MNPEILDFLNTQRVSALAIEMLDGSPHVATVHFTHTENPFLFYFETYREYRKAEALFGRDASRASLVIGFGESVMKTFQLDGEVRLLRDDEREHFDSVYFQKFPERKEKSKDPKFVCFVFEPKWWRYTDWTKPTGKFVLTSKTQ
ncbi:MAG: pyridoxamine 5'-phosphate oxidase family protein [Candidatus Pacebacteria bacterium]|nr:pyridoxamine 5'-phosphate oxidase family protein [Candidatus Paceibacterota bacterium]